MKSAPQETIGALHSDRSSEHHVAGHAVNDPTMIEDSRETRRPNRIGWVESAPGATGAPTTGGDPVLPRVLTPGELATMLRVRRRSVYEAISRGDIPGVRRIGRKVRIDCDSVLAWMADGHGRAPRSSRR